MGWIQKWGRALVAALSITSLGQFCIRPAEAQQAPFCQQTSQAIAEKANLLRAAASGNRDAQNRYRSLLARHAAGLRQCRQRNWPQTEAIWIRLYPCDARSGVLDGVLDQIVNRGYNQVNVEVFAGGKVLLPANQNPTPWPPILAGTSAANTDLLAQAIQKGRDRGLKVYAWMFTLNVGANYLSRGDRTAALARNGWGQTSLTASTAGLGVDLRGPSEEAFTDPYSTQTRQDYVRLVQAIAQRRPDGILFDYVRYPRGTGGLSVASRIQDLWVYGEASRRALLGRATNYKGMELMQRYLNQGYLTLQDLREANALFPGDREPMWQGRDPRRSANLPINRRLAVLQNELWQLSLSHAFQGVLDYLNLALQPVRSAHIPAGIVFFPDGNQTIGQGYDSRLQFWEYFPPSLEWHPMSYAVCGKTNCILSQIQRVLNGAPKGTQVKPVLAGIWQRSVSNRPPLEAQMRGLYGIAPNLRTVSHFAYSWQEPGSDRDRKACRL